jgi:hypothetical protein
MEAERHSGINPNTIGATLAFSIGQDVFALTSDVI